MQDRIKNRKNNILKEISSCALVWKEKAPFLKRKIRREMNNHQSKKIILKLFISTLSVLDYIY